MRRFGFLFIFPLLVVALACGGGGGGSVSISPLPSLRFVRTTDTVSIAGHISLGTDCTFEAWVNPSSLTGFGRIWDEWEVAQTDKWLAIEPGNVDGYVWPGSPTVPFSGPAAISTGVFHHIAYVKEGTTERIYMDGLLLASRACGSSIGNSGTSAMWLGGFFRDGSDSPSFLGALHSLRISNVARYAGAAYTPPDHSIPTDANTLLLYDFTVAFAGNSVVDLSGNGHTGTLGVGYPDATTPDH